MRCCFSGGWCPYQVFEFKKNEYIGCMKEGYCKKQGKEIKI